MHNKLHTWGQMWDQGRRRRWKSECVIADAEWMQSGCGAEGFKQSGFIQTNYQSTRNILFNEDAFQTSK